MIPEVVNKTSCVLDAIRQQGDEVFKILGFLRGHSSPRGKEGSKTEPPSTPLGVVFERLEEASRELERIRDDLVSINELLGINPPKVGGGAATS